jgi:hypothetical protein
VRVVKSVGTLAAAAGLFAVACSSETVARPPPPPVHWEAFRRAEVDAGPATAPTAKESTAAQDYLAALGAPAFPLVGPLFGADARASFPGMDDAHDRAGVVRTHAALFGAFDQRRFVASRIWRTAAAQTVEWTMSGVQNGDWMGVTATHKPITIKGVTLLWTNDDGTLADAHVYFDVAVAKAQLGAGPKELAGVPTQVPPQGPPQIVDQRPLDPDHAPVVRAALDALENGAESAYLGQMADDVEVDCLDRAAPTRGRDAPAAYFKAMHKAIAQLDATLQNAWTVGSFVVVEYSLAGEQIAPIGWVPLQRDRVVKEHLVEVDEIRDDKIARIWRFANPNEIVGP